MNGTSLRSPSDGARSAAEKRIVAPAAREEDASFDSALRPQTLDEFVGQKRVVSNLDLTIEAARRRDEMIEHTLLSGMPGLGKTTLAQLIARELDAELITTSGPALERASDLAGILMNLRPRSVLFIDEVHRLRAAMEEYLYSAMEDFCIDIMLDQGPDARSMRVPIKRFTLVAATTREGLLSLPLRGRFGLRERLDIYPADDLTRILIRSAGLLNVALDDDAGHLLAQRARGTPRVANRFLRRARDVAQVEGTGRVSRKVVEETLTRLGVDERGLEELDRRILRTIVAHDGQPVGLKTIAVSVGEEPDTIEEIYEPYLIQQGYVQKTPQGRRASEAAWRLLDLPLPPTDNKPQGGGRRGQTRSKQSQENMVQ